MKNEKLIVKFINFSFGGLISAIIGFFLIPFITRFISPKEYGIGSMYLLITNILMLLSLLGLDQGFVRYFYEEDNKSGLLKKCLKFSICMTVILIIMIILFRKKILMFLFGEFNIKMMLCLIITIVFMLLNRYSFLLIRLNQKSKLFSLLQIFNQIFNLIFIVIIFKIFGDSYETIVISSTITIVLTTVISIFFERKNWNFRKQKIVVTNRELLKYSLPFTITMALTWIFQSSDKVVIRIFSDIDELGFYAVAFKIVSILNIIQTGFTTFWVPVAYEKYMKEPSNLKFFEKVYTYISLVMFGMAIIVLMSKDIIIILLGEKFRAASNIMPCLVLMPIMYTISETTVLGINFKKKTKYHMIISIVVAILNIIGNISLVPYLGAKGAAISTGLAYIIFFSLRTYFSLREVKFRFDLKKFYLSTIIVLSYAIYLTFNELGKSGFLLGCLLITIILRIYSETTKDIFFVLRKSIKKKKLIYNE